LRLSFGGSCGTREGLDGLFGLRSRIVMGAPANKHAQDFLEIGAFFPVPSLNVRTCRAGDSRSEHKGILGRSESILE